MKVRSSLVISMSKFLNVDNYCSTRQKRQEFEAVQIGNIDQNAKPNWHGSRNNQYQAWRSNATIGISTPGRTKRSFTLTLTAMANGRNLPAYVQSPTATKAPFRVQPFLCIVNTILLDIVTSLLKVCTEPIRLSNNCVHWKCYEG